MTDVPPGESDAPMAVSPGVAAAGPTVGVDEVVGEAVATDTGPAGASALGLVEAGGVPDGVRMSGAELAGVVPIGVTTLAAELAAWVPLGCVVVVAVGAGVAATGVEVVEDVADVVAPGEERKKLLEPRPLPV